MSVYLPLVKIIQLEKSYIFQDLQKFNDLFNKITFKNTVEPGLFDTGLFDTLAYPTRFCIPLKLAISTHVFYPGLFDTGLFDTPAYSTPISTPFMKNTLFLPRFIRQLY